MSGGVSLPRFTVTARQRPNVAVAAQGRPVVASVTVRGQQGAQGETGLQGPQGLPGDYGYIRYGEMAGTSPRQIPAMTEMPFVVQAPQVLTNNLRGPFADFVFLNGDSLLRARKAGDSYHLGVRFSVVPDTFGGWIRVGINIVGNISELVGPVSTRTIPLEGAAGSVTRVDEPFDVFPQAGFLANGATISIYASVPVSISDEVLFVKPDVAAA